MERERGFKVGIGQDDEGGVQSCLISRDFAARLEPVNRMMGSTNSTSLTGNTDETPR